MTHVVRSVTLLPALVDPAGTYSMERAGQLRRAGSTSRLSAAEHGLETSDWPVLGRVHSIGACQTLKGLLQ
jgi:hypothetical protein